jgi:two-component system, NarL family, nitrate/nitrite response regulator NarL
MADLVSAAATGTALLEHPAAPAIRFAEQTEGGVPADGLSRSILLFDPQALVRQTLRAALEARTGFRLVAEARNLTEAAAAASALHPDAAFVHACMDPSELVHVVELIKERAPHCQVILIGAEQDVDLMIAAIDAGASGFFTKNSSFAEIVDAASKATSGQLLLPRSNLEELLTHLLKRRGEELQTLRKISRLTERERHVLSLLAAGEDNERIGKALVISPHTARTHIQNILSKLGLHSRLEAVAFVRRLGTHSELLRPSL